jgi:hypothetical protein
MSLGDLLMVAFFVGMLVLWALASRKMGVG